MTHNSTKHGPKIALFEPDIPQNTAAIIRTGRSHQSSRCIILHIRLSCYILFHHITYAIIILRMHHIIYIKSSYCIVYHHITYVCTAEGADGRNHQVSAGGGGG